MNLSPVCPCEARYVHALRTKSKFIVSLEVRAALEVAVPAYITPIELLANVSWMYSSISLPALLANSLPCAAIIGNKVSASNTSEMIE